MEETADTGEDLAAMTATMVAGEIAEVGATIRKTRVGGEIAEMRMTMPANIIRENPATETGGTAVNTMTTTATAVVEAADGEEATPETAEVGEHPEDPPPSNQVATGVHGRKTTTIAAAAGEEEAMI